MENKLLKYLPKKNQWVIVLLIGILLVVIALPTKTDSNSDLDLEFELDDENTTDIERRLENMLGKMQDVGEVHVMITFRDDEQVEGIVVIADGGGKAVVVREITGVIQALFDVDSHKIKVIERNQKD